MDKQEMTVTVEPSEESVWELHTSEDENLEYRRRIYIHAAPDIIAAGFVVTDNRGDDVVYKAAVSVCVNSDEFVPLFEPESSFVDAQEAEAWCDSEWFSPKNLSTRLQFAQADQMNDLAVILFSLMDAAQQAALYALPREYLPESMTGQPPIESPLNMRDDGDFEGE